MDHAETITFAEVARPDRASRTAADDRHSTLLKPAHSLGELEELGAWLAACQGTTRPRPLPAASVVLLAADHGVAVRDVSTYPASFTARFVEAALAGGTAINVLADVAGARLRVCDVAVDIAEPHPGTGDYKVRGRSGAIDVEDALTAQETHAAVRAGVRLADAEVDGGVDLLLPAPFGVAASTPASVLVAALTDTEPAAVVGRGSGIDDHAWMRKVRVVRDALRRGRAVRTDPIGLLGTVGGVDLAVLAGFLAQAAVRRTPVLLDGLTSTAAGLVAEELAPGAREWWRAAHRSREPAHARALDQLDLTPILDLGISLEQGTASATALPTLRMAARVLTEMSTHE